MKAAGERPERGKAEPYSYAPRAAPPTCAIWELPLVDVQGSLLVESVEPPARPLFTEDQQELLAEEARRSFEAGRRRGVEEGRAVERAAQAPAEQHRAEELRHLLEDFSKARNHYLGAVEQEVVRLALAISARILRHEAQMDPLHLMGPVRVALGQLAAAAEVRLHVPSMQADLWKEAIALLPNPPVRPVVIAEDAMVLGDCRLETSLGTADLSTRAQLNEIERGFFDGPRAAAQLSPAGEALP